MNNIIFLDFDGVLNSFAEGSYHTNTDETYGPSKTISQRLKKLCDETNSKIIISSNWRKFEIDGQYVFSGEKVTNPLRKVYELYGDYIIGTLPPTRHVTKSEALILYFEENGVPEHWVVLDDDPREGFASTHDYNIAEHYIETVPEFGIDSDILKKMKKILKR